VPPIAKERFLCLKAAVSGGIDGRGGGMNVSYPEPFGPDIASWIGASIMGSLDLKNEEWQTKSR
jgi:actin-related protein